MSASFVTLRIAIIERRKSSLDSAGDGVGCSFACNESNRYYTALRNLSIDPARNILAGHSAWRRRADDRRFSSRGVKRTTVSSRVRASGGFRFFPSLLHPYAVSRRLIVR